MRIDISKILNYQLDEIAFEDTITLDNSYLKTTEIRSLSDINLFGIIKREIDDIISINVSISGVMILPCSISLVDVAYPFEINVYEVLDEEINSEYLKIEHNSIDIIPIVWQNIVLEIPLKVVSPTLNRNSIQGDGWTLKSED